MRAAEGQAVTFLSFCAKVTSLVGAKRDTRACIELQLPPCGPGYSRSVCDNRLSSAKPVIQSTSKLCKQ